jgi:hypothetical protein
MKKLTPIEYEQYCLNIFRLEGWAANATAITGDQGADIVCESDGMLAVIQCKRYSQPVGNAAVQEVLAARVFYGAALAAVVTNASFTKSAVVLAKKASIHLLHDSQLREWAKKYREGDAIAFSSAQEMMGMLNIQGYRVKRAKNGVFSVVTDSGIRHITGERAFLAYAEQLIK